jgi:ribosomal protein S25
LEVLLIHAEEILINDGKGSWRRKYWSVHDKRLRKIMGKKVYEESADFLEFLSEDIPKNFTTKHISLSSGINLNIARKMAYTLRKMGVIEVIGKQGRAPLYTISNNFD